MSYKLYLFPPSPQSLVSGRHGTDLVTRPAVPDVEPVSGRAGVSVDFPDSLPNGQGCEIIIEDPGVSRQTTKGILYFDNGQFPDFPFHGRPSSMQTDEWRAVELLGTVIPQPPTNGSGVVGCQNGRLADPVAWFFNRIKRQIGMPADDYAAVLSASGIPAAGGPEDLIPIPDPAGCYGIRLQIGAEGPRGRWYAPSTTADSLGYYTCEFQCITDMPDQPGRLVWAHIVFKAGTYFAHPCGVPVSTRDTRPVWIPLAAV